MVCKNCGNTLPDGSNYCTNCDTWQDEEIKNKKPESKNESQNNNINNEVNINKAINNKPAKFLVENEHIIAKARWTLIPFILLWVIIIVAEIIFNIINIDNILRIRLNNESSLVINLKATSIAIIIITILIAAISIFLFLIRREFVVTDKKIYGRVGIIGTKQFIIPLNKINYISIRYNILSRILNSALIIVFPGNAFWGIHFFYVSHANDFKKQIEQAIYNNK